VPKREDVVTDASTANDALANSEAEADVSDESWKLDIPVQPVSGVNGRAILGSSAQSGELLNGKWIGGRGFAAIALDGIITIGPTTLMQNQEVRVGDRSPWNGYTHWSTTTSSGFRVHVLVWIEGEDE
jgi:hypothetical protein